MKTKYDTLKKEYDELRIRHDNAYAKKILAGAKRDELLKFAYSIVNETLDGDEIRYNAQKLIKSITNQ